MANKRAWDWILALIGLALCLFFLWQISHSAQHYLVPTATLLNISSPDVTFPMHFAYRTVLDLAEEDAKSRARLPDADITSRYHQQLLRTADFYFPGRPGGADGRGSQQRS
jgi:hypothetical protein